MNTCENDRAEKTHLEQIRALYTELAETPDKDFGWGKGRANARILTEAYRVLRPGGRLQIADMVKDPSVGEVACCTGKESWADCVTGTLDPDAFIALMKQAGFSNVELIAYTGYRTAVYTVGALFAASRAPKL